MWFNVHGFFGFQGAEGQSWRRHNPIPQSSVLECVLFTRPGALKHGWTLNSFDVFVFWSTLCWYHNINWGYKLRPCNSRPPPAWTWATQLCPLVGFVNIKRWGYTCNLCPVWWIGWSRTYNTKSIWDDAQLVPWLHLQCGLNLMDVCSCIYLQMSYLIIQHQERPHSRLTCTFAQ